MRNGELLLQPWVQRCGSCVKADDSLRVSREPSPCRLHRFCVEEENGCRKRRLRAAGLDAAAVWEGSNPKCQVPLTAIPVDRGASRSDGAAL